MTRLLALACLLAPLAASANGFPLCKLWREMHRCQGEEWSQCWNEKAERISNFLRETFDEETAYRFSRMSGPLSTCSDRSFKWTPPGYWPGQNDPEAN